MLPQPVLCPLPACALRFLHAQQQPIPAPRVALAAPVDTTPASQALPPLYLAFPGLGSDYVGMARELMAFAPFARAIAACDHVLGRIAPNMPVGQWLTEGIAVADQMGTPGLFVTLTAIAISLVDLLTTLGLRPDGFVGHSLGETACGFAAGLLTRREALHCALLQGRAAACVPGAMVGVLASADTAMAQLQSASSLGGEVHAEGMLDVHVACYNSASSCTLVGSPDSVELATTVLRDAGLACVAIETAGAACHWPAGYAAVLDELEAELAQVLGRSPRARPATWLSTTSAGAAAAAAAVAAATDTDAAMEESQVACSPALTPTYIAQGLAQPVHFSQAAARLPEGALVLEIGARPLLGPLLPEGRGLCPLRLTSKSSADVPVLAACIGDLYSRGLIHTVPSAWLVEPISPRERAAALAADMALEVIASGTKVALDVADSGMGSGDDSDSGSPPRSPRATSPDSWGLAAVVHV
jgi:fatty acid synthase